MELLKVDDKLYSQYEYTKEAEFEKRIIEYSNDIFGVNSLYIDIKKKIGEDKIVTIPDGYLIDFSFESDPHLYIIENELVRHDPFRHIGQQILRFAISYKASGRIIKSFLYEHIVKNKKFLSLVEAGSKKAGYRNIDAFLEDIIFEKPIRAVVIIDDITSDLESVLSQLTINTDIIEFKSYKNGNNFIKTGRIGYYCCSC